jgi:uroporphyrinogen-III decarboxylase
MFADDSIQLISTEMYEDLVFPFHKRLVDTFSEGGPNGIHLCGDATRHFPFLRDHLNMQSFDTGFPVDFTWLRETLGPDVEIQGGPSAPFLVEASPGEVSEEVRRILASGIMKGGRFVLREGNNLAPGTPLENLWAMYDTVREWGTYEV